MAYFLAQIEFFTEKFLYFYSSSAKYVPKNISMAGYTSWNLCFFVTLILRIKLNCYNIAKKSNFWYPFDILVRENAY